MAIPLLAALAGVKVVGSVISFGANRRAAAANYRFAKRERDDILARGEEEVERYEMDLAGLLGTQRAVIAASMIDTEFGSAKQVREQTERFGAEDIATIRLNATRAAWGVMQQAKINHRAANAQAGANLLAGVADAATTLVGSGVGGKAWDWYRGRGRGLPRGVTPLNMGAGSGYDFTPRG